LVVDWIIFKPPYATSLSLANFVGIGLLNVFSYTPRCLLLAASLSFETKMALITAYERKPEYENTWKSKEIKT